MIINGMELRVQKHTTIFMISWFLKGKYNNAIENSRKFLTIVQG
jgi:hypothetical protein